MKGTILVMVLFIMPMLFGERGNMQVVQDSTGGWVVDSIGEGIAGIPGRRNY